jgi:hypothetical protein
MTQRELGDVEFVVIQLEHDRLSPRVLEALLRQVEIGALRLLDFLIVRRVSPGDYHLTEVDGDEFVLAGLELRTPGLVSEDDARHFLPELPVGTLAAVILVEPTWGERLSRDLAPRGDRVLATQPIPAAIANAVLDAVRRQS